MHHSSAMQSAPEPRALSRPHRIARFGLAASLTPILVLLSSLAAGFELEPRSYTNLPVGMNFLGTGVIFQTGDVASGSSVVLDDAEVDGFTQVLAYTRALDLRGRSGKVDVIGAYNCLEGSAQTLGVRYERDVCGLGDPSLKLSVNLVGAPAMTLAELRSHRQDLVIGVGLRISPPLGSYAPSKLLNPGTNRWTIHPEAGLSKSSGPWTFEAIGSASFYSDNDEFLGGARQKQDPIYALQAHVIYTFERGHWVALDANRYEGGRTETNGLKADNLQRNSRFGVTLAIPLDRHHSIKLAASQGVITRAGGDFKTFTAVWQYRWGGGL